MHFRDPSFTNLQAIAAMCEGGMVADIIAAVASIDPVDGGSGPMSRTTPRSGSGCERDAKRDHRRYPRPRSALLPMLHLVQSEEGTSRDDGIEFCAEQLGITAGRGDAAS